MNIFNPKYLNYKEQVQKNKKDIEVLQRIIKDTYHTDLTLETTTTTIAVSDTDIPSTAYTGFLTDANGLFYNIITIKDGIAYLKYWFQLKGEQGIAGPVGPANTLSIGSVTKGDDASATITGEAPNQTLNLVLPKGDQGPQGEPGPKGDQGSTGPANTLSIGSVVKGDNASASITGEAPNQTLNLVLPKGDQGAKGDKGDAGQGYNDLGLWVQGGAYNPYDIVTYNGSSYNCIVAINPSDVSPNVDTTHFELFAKGGDQGPKGDQGEQGIQGIPGPIGPSGEINFYDLIKKGNKTLIVSGVSSGTINSNSKGRSTITQLAVNDSLTFNAGDYYALEMKPNESSTLGEGEYTLFQVMSINGATTRLLLPIFNQTSNNDIIADGVQTWYTITYSNLTYSNNSLSLEYTVYNDITTYNPYFKLYKITPKKKRVEAYEHRIDIITNSESDFQNNQKTDGMFNSKNFPYKLSKSIDATLFNSLESIGLNVGESCLVSLSYKDSTGSYSSIHDCTMTKLGVPQTETGYVGRPCYVISMFPNCHSFYNNIDVFKGSLYIAIEQNKITIYTANKTDLRLYEYYK